MPLAVLLTMRSLPAAPLAKLLLRILTVCMAVKKVIELVGRKTRPVVYWVVPVMNDIEVLKKKSPELRMLLTK